MLIKNIMILSDINFESSFYNKSSFLLGSVSCEAIEQMDLLRVGNRQKGFRV